MPVLTRQQVYELSEVVDQLDIPVLCYGLRTDFEVNYLLAANTYWHGPTNWLN